MLAGTFRPIATGVVLLAAGAWPAAAAETGPSVAYAPDVVMVGRRFMVAVDVAPNAPALRLALPSAVELYDRTTLPTQSSQRRYYLRAKAADPSAAIKFRLAGRDASVQVRILTLHELLQPRELNGIKLRVVDTFAGGIGAGVYDVVEDLGTQVRHPHLIGVRIAQGKLHPDLRGVLDHSVNLATQVPCRSLHLC